MNMNRKNLLPQKRATASAVDNDMEVKRRSLDSSQPSTSFSKSSNKTTLQRHEEPMVKSDSDYKMDENQYSRISDEGIAGEENILECEKSADTKFADVDIHPLPESVKPVVEDEEIEPFYHDNQIYLSKVIIERLMQILENNQYAKYKLRPHIKKKMNQTLSPVEESQCFENFNFVIYTAISNMLQDQTAQRVADPYSEVLSPSIYRGSKNELATEAKKKTQKYHPEVIKTTHEKLKKEVEKDKKTLFLIVADEAHVAITKTSEGEKEEEVKAQENASHTLVNSWKDNEHPNVIVLQVSATPYNLLTENSRIPKTLVAKKPNECEHGDISYSLEFDTSPLSEVEKDRRGAYIYSGEQNTRVERRIVKLNHVKWAESHDLQIKQGIVTTLKMYDVWLGVKSDTDSSGEWYPAVMATLR